MAHGLSITSKLLGKWIFIRNDVHGIQRRLCRMDVTSKASMETAFDEVVNKLGKIDNW